MVVKSVNMVALDFDGVICNSVDECLVVGYNAYRRMKHNGQRVEDPEDIETELVEFFRRNRWLAPGGGQFYGLFDLYFRGTRKMSRSLFLELVKTQAVEIKEYTNLFYEERERFKSMNPDKWYSLNPLYADTREPLKRLAREAEVRIVTLKDRKSVREILEFNGVGEVPIKDRKNCKAAGSKASLIDEMRKKEGCKKEIYFLDDNSEHLARAKGPGIRLFWAEWGYEKGNSPPKEPGLTFCSDLNEFAEIVLSGSKIPDIFREIQVDTVFDSSDMAG